MRCRRCKLLIRDSLLSAETFVTAALLGWALAIAVIDWRQRRVPNLLLLTLLLPAVAVLSFRGVGLLPVGWVASLIGLAMGLVVTLPGYTVSKLGAGDVKLAAVMGFVLGWPLVSWALMLAALVLGAMSLAVVAIFGYANAKTVRLPAAVALAGGFAVVLLAQWAGWSGEWR